MGGKLLTREEALASLAEYQAKHPQMRHLRKGYKALGDDITFSRFIRVKGEAKPEKGPRQLKLPTLGNSSVEAGRSIFHRKGVKHPDDLKNILTSGYDNVKIGRDVRKGKLFYGRRFAIRWSNGEAPNDNALPIRRASDVPAGAFVCPEQTGKVDGCGKCGLCWNTAKNVAFAEH